MRILHLTTRDATGGAAVATNRLHRALEKHPGIESHVLALDVTQSAPNVHGPSRSRSRAETLARHWLDGLPSRLYPQRSTRLFSNQIIPNRLKAKILSIAPDVIHLHWVCGGFFQLGLLGSINIPHVWTLHDMWPFTGGCHYSGDCTRFKTKCGSCPELGSTRAYDLSTLNMWRKKNCYKNFDVTMIAPSRWMRDCVAESTLMRGKRVKVLPNALDLDRFRPIDKRCAREALGLPLDGKIILCGAVGVGDSRKGFDILCEAVTHLGSRGEVDKLHMLVFGRGTLDAFNNLNIGVHSLGYLKDPLSMPIVCSAADVAVVPSRQESFGQTATEAMACGTPVAAFKVGGLLDIVEHGQDGWLADPFDAQSLAWAILSSLNADQPDIARKARAKALHLCDETKVAREHQELYQSISNKFNSI